MIFISMLFSSALEEYFTKNYSGSNGNDNSVYKWLDAIREDIGPMLMGFNVDNSDKYVREK